MDFENQVNKLISAFRKSVRKDFEELAAMIYRNKDKDFENAKAEWVRMLLNEAITNQATWSGGLASARNMEESIIRDIATHMAADDRFSESRFQQWLDELEDKEGQEQNGST